jgi:hypothetical protein
MALVGLFSGVLRKENFRIGSHRHRGPERFEYFFIDDYVELLRSLLKIGVCFDSLVNPMLSDASIKKRHYIKHDIHHDLGNTYLMAAAEAQLGVVSTYFMMHENFVNRRYFGQSATWATLRAMQDMRHHIGLHVDGFLLIKQFGDLREGIAETRRVFAAEGIDLTVGNTHGNSAYQSKFNFEPMNFYREVARPTDCTDPFWLSHYSRYSLADLGFQVWADTAVWQPAMGEQLLDFYVSDNSTGICAGGSRKSTWDEVGKPWDLSEHHRRRIVQLVCEGSCIYLIHPQFYRPGQSGR